MSVLSINSCHFPNTQKIEPGEVPGLEVFEKVLKVFVGAQARNPELTPGCWVTRACDESRVIYQPLEIGTVRDSERACTLTELFLFCRSPPGITSQAEEFLRR